MANHHMGRAGIHHMGETLVTLHRNRPAFMECHGLVRLSVCGTPAAESKWHPKAFRFIWVLLVHWGVFLSRKSSAILLAFFAAPQTWCPGLLCGALVSQGCGFALLSGGCGKARKRSCGALRCEGVLGRRCLHFWYQSTWRGFLPSLLSRCPSMHEVPNSINLLDTSMHACTLCPCGVPPPPPEGRGVVFPQAERGMDDSVSELDINVQRSRNIVCLLLVTRCLCAAGGWLLAAGCRLLLQN